MERAHAEYDIFMAMGTQSMNFVILRCARSSMLLVELVCLPTESGLTLNT